MKLLLIANANKVLLYLILVAGVVVAAFVGAGVGSGEEVDTVEVDNTLIEGTLEMLGRELQKERDRNSELQDTVDDQEIMLDQLINELRDMTEPTCAPSMWEAQGENIHSSALVLACWYGLEYQPIPPDVMPQYTPDVVLP